jgi:cyclase
MRRICSILLSFFFISSMPLGFADHHAQSSFKVSNISKDLILLQGKGGNIALSRGRDGILIIDNDYAEMGDALLEQIEKIADGSLLKFILNTHWHGDHTGNNASLNMQENVNIVAHDNVRERLSTRQEMPAFNRVVEAHPKHALPTITFPDSMTLHFNDETLTIEHYASGHTDGDAVIFFEKNNTVHMGDHMFYPMFPFIDMNSGGNAISFTKNVGDILDKIDDKTTVIPGHGPLTDKEGLKNFHRMLVSTIAEVNAMKAAGLSLEDAQGKGLSQEWKKWNVGFIKEPVWISFIYKSL